MIDIGIGMPCIPGIVVVPIGRGLRGDGGPDTVDVDVGEYEGC